AFGNVTGRGPFSGASTITQQLVRSSVLTNERTLSRKIREAILSIQVSRLYTKDQILEMYLNTVFLGNQAYGVEAAAQTYFRKPAKALTLAEAAVLAGLPRSPSTTNPFQDEQAAKAEQRRVLDAMVYHGYLTEADAAAAAAEPLAYNTQQFAALKAPHFVLWVREQLESNPKYGQEAFLHRGLEVTTTLDIRMQEMAELIVRHHISQLGRFNAKDAALVALNPSTGEILAMVGSADYANKAIQGEVNVALAPRQPGSSIKPITYLAAFQKGWSPVTIIEDEETVFPGNPPYKPRNYDEQFHGKVTVRTALANSYNIPAVKTLQYVGVPAMIDLARKMGITTFQNPQRYGLALTLGGGDVRLLELTSAYGVFATGGQRVAPVSILKVTDTRGKVLDEYAGPRPQRVVDEQRAYLITSILSDNEARTPGFGSNSPLRLSRPAAVKTGTTDDFKDNWTVGYTSQLVTGVWVGNADGVPMRGTTGLTGAAPIWHDFMEFALKPLPVDPLSPPPGLQRVAVGRESGKLWTEGCPEPKLEDFFVAGTAPKEKCEAPTPVPTSTPERATPAPRATQTPRSDERSRARVTPT
ncbi:MAG: transglycosylase domain-containing protein, partial [Chloroflexota bacterium]